MLRLVLAAAVGFVLLGTVGVATAEEPANSTESAGPAREDPPAERPPGEDPGEVEPPTFLVSAVATCHEGTASVDVRVLEGVTDPFLVTLLRVRPGVGSESKKTTLDEVRGIHMVTFEPVTTGDYIVHVEGANAPADDLPVTVAKCADLDPGADPLTVKVECKGGWGIVTFQVANPATGDVKKYTLTLSDLSSEYKIELGAGEFLRIAENTFEDRTFKVTLTSGDTEITKEFTVKCEKGNPPKVAAFSACDGKDELTAPAPVQVAVENPNRTSVDYDVELDVRGSKQTKKLSVGGGGHGEVIFPSVAAGEHPVTVTGKDGTESTGIALVDFCGDVKIDPDGLQVSSRCAAKTSVVTFRFYLKPPFPATAKFSVDGTDTFNQTVTHGGEGPYEWVRYSGKFADATYTARLVGGGVNTTEKFVVDCDGVPNSTPTTTAQPTTAPAPQGRAGGLASTGAAVGEMAMLGLLGLGVGGGLVLLGQRRRARQD